MMRMGIPIVILYIDPGTGAALWQLLAAAALGGLFYFRKIKAWIVGLVRRPEDRPESEE
jgi:hypothetical protein